MTSFNGYIVALEDNGTVIVRVPVEEKVLVALRLGSVRLVQDDKNAETAGK